MKRALSVFTSLALFAPLSLTALLPARAQADNSDKGIASRTSEIEGVKLHYLTAGHGAALILLHGYAETSLMWKPIIPLLAERFTVIAPDLPGIGDSAIPANGLDMKTAGILGLASVTPSGHRENHSFAPLGLSVSLLLPTAY